MRKLLLIGLVALMSCAKEPIENLEPKKRLVSSFSNHLVNENWRMEYYVKNGIATMGNNSVWDFTNSNIIISSNLGENTLDYYTNGSRIYITEDDNVVEYFIDYISKDSLFLSSVNTRYSFVNAQ